MTIYDDELEAAIKFPRLCTQMAELATKCQRPLGQLAQLEAERVRQQERANKEAVERCEAEERLAAARARIAELEKHAADGWTTPDEVKAQLGSNRARIAELTKERDEAAERAGRAEQAMSSLRVLHAEGGKFHVTLDVAKEVAAAICDCLAVLTDNAKNYVECSMSNKHGDRWIMTIIKPTGKTPRDMRVEAEQDRDAARSEVAKLKALLAEAAQVIEANGRESGNQMFNVLIGGAPWSRDPIGVLKRINTALAAGNDAVKS